MEDGNNKTDDRYNQGQQSVKLNMSNSHTAPPPSLKIWKRCQKRPTLSTKFLLKQAWGNRLQSGTGVPTCIADYITSNVGKVIFLMITRDYFWSRDITWHYSILLVITWYYPWLHMTIIAAKAFFNRYFNRYRLARNSCSHSARDHSASIPNKKYNFA